MPINWKEVYRFVPLMLLWGCIIDPFIIESIVKNDFFNPYAIVHWIGIIVFGIWSIQFLHKHRDDKKYFRDISISVAVLTTFYFVVLFFETHFSSLSIVAYLLPFAIALLSLVPVKIIEHKG
ncbi:hypothetical protein SAMN04487866_11956 [Thermoactinomyces sp. DSM 45891]|uniref:hypothetical protein n=1 Tax=Thermoactinomyces sp. DSM 45891 TaxID=1761907 RepID=UPI000912A722|nr:hypothetical protein [Thermoactinomyces sp. DSM 45891]SFX71782.1 hypothetical protein SAMN04487866_11956 [Thermoactinomyces sp. DSM 45891]